MASTVQVGLLLSVLGSIQMTSAADYPPVERGQPVVLTCSGRSESRQRRSLFWMITSPGAKIVNQAICHSTEASCLNYDPSRYVVTATFNDTHFTTLLTILGISQHERFMIFNCTLYEKEKDWAYIVRSWNMSDIVYPPETPSALVNNTSTHVYTNKVKVSMNPEVYIKPSPDCEKNNKTLRFLCTSRWLPHATNLVWFKNSTLISNTTTNHSVDAGFHTSRSSIEIQNSPGVGSLRCQVNFVPGGSTPNKTINAELLVDKFVPSVYFTYSGLPVKHLVIGEWKSLKTLECRVNDSNPVVNTVLVVCQTSMKVHTFSSMTRSLSFDIPRGTPNDMGICFCSASQCYSRNINFTFSVGYPAHSQSTFPRPRPESFINIICYVTAGCFVLVFLVFFLATVMFLARRWNKLYSYIYGKIYSQSQTQAKVMLNGGHHYYSIASPTTSDAFMAMPDGPSLASENIVGNRRISVPPSPNSLCSQHVYSNVDVDSDEEYPDWRDMFTTLHTSPEETNTYHNTANWVIPIPATSQAITLVDVVQGKSSKLLQSPDLFLDKQQPYSNTSLPPKPCRPHRCPDLLLHRSSLNPQISWSDEEQS